MKTVITTRAGSSFVEQEITDAYPVFDQAARRFAVTERVTGIVLAAWTFDEIENVLFVPGRPNQARRARG